MAITLEERHKGTCPFGVFHISLGSTLCTESELKSEWAPGNVPLLAIALPEYHLNQVFRTKKYEILLSKEAFLLK